MNLNRKVSYDVNALKIFQKLEQNLLGQQYRKTADRNTAGPFAHDLETTLPKPFMTGASTPFPDPRRHFGSTGATVSSDFE
jgi:hypothetical protein